MFLPVGEQHFVEGVVIYLVFYFANVCVVCGYVCLFHVLCGCCILLRMLHDGFFRPRGECRYVVNSSRDCSLMANLWCFPRKCGSSKVAVSHLW